MSTQRDSLESDKSGSARAPGNGNGSADSQEVSPQEQEGAAKKVNLYELEEFRKWQAAQDKKWAAEQAEKAQMAARLRELETAGMPEVDKLKYALAERDRRLQEIEEERLRAQQAEQVKEMRNKDLKRISKASGVPLDYLDQATNYDEAWELVDKYREANGDEAERRSEANRPYIPDAKSSSPATRQSSALKEAIERRDGVAYLKAILEGGG